MKQAHICLDETLGVRYAILPGDPARLDRVSLPSFRTTFFRSVSVTVKS